MKKLLSLFFILGLMSVLCFGVTITGYTASTASGGESFLTTSNAYSIFHAISRNVAVTTNFSGDVSINGVVSVSALSLAGDRRTAWPTGGGGGLQTYVYTLPPDAMDFPPSSNDMATTYNTLLGAPVTVLPANNAISAVSLNQVATSCRTLVLDIPAGATTISFNFTGRGADTSAGDVIMFIASRAISTNAGVPSWSIVQTSAVANSASGFFTKYSERNTLATYGLTAGNSYQLAIGRATGTASNTYANPFLLTGLRIEVQ